MRFSRLILALTCLLSTAPVAQQATVTELFSEDLKDLPGKEGLMITVVYPPGSSDPIHRHNAHAFVYVLEGSIVMQVKGGKELTLTPGQTFYEGPEDVHVIGRNASKTKPAKFVVCKEQRRTGVRTCPIRPHFQKCAASSSVPIEQACHPATGSACRSRSNTS